MCASRSLMRTTRNSRSTILKPTGAAASTLSSSVSMAIASRSDCCSGRLELFLVVDVGGAADPGVDRAVGSAQRPGAERRANGKLPSWRWMRYSVRNSVPVRTASRQWRSARSASSGWTSRVHPHLVVRVARPAGEVDAEVVDVGRRAVRRRHPHDVGYRVEHGVDRPSTGGASGGDAVGPAGPEGGSELRNRRLLS